MSKEPRRPSVFIPNKGAHNYTSALKFGDLIFITEGYLDPLGTGFMYRKLSQELNSSRADDYLLIAGLPIMNVLAASILGRLHGQLNLLLFRHGEYIKRSFMLDNLLEAFTELDKALEEREENENIGNQGI